MSCPLDTREELLVAYGSGQLGAAEAASLEVHLQDCAACREFVAAQRAVWEALDLWQPAPVSPGFGRLVERPPHRKRQWYLHRGIPLAAAASLLLAAVLLLNPSGPARPQSGGSRAQVEQLQPEQVVSALDELDAIAQFDHLMKPDSSDPDSKM